MIRFSLLRLQLYWWGFELSFLEIATTPAKARSFFCIGWSDINGFSFGLLWLNKIGLAISPGFRFFDLMFNHDKVLAEVFGGPIIFRWGCGSAPSKNLKGEEMTLIHLYDPSLGGRQAACGHNGPKFRDDLELPDKFGKLPDDRRCQECNEELAVFYMECRTCPICRETFETPAAANSHKHEHALQKVSHRKEVPTFVIDTQGITSDSTRALTLTLARTELRKYFPTQEFDFVPSRMLSKTIVSTADIQVVTYLVIPRQ